jgi:hypothetical protein
MRLTGPNQHELRRFWTQRRVQDTDQGRNRQPEINRSEPVVRRHGGPCTSSRLSKALRVVEGKKILPVSRAEDRRISTDTIAGSERAS